MSFILDALKKSETDRQQKGSAEFAGVPTSTRRESAPRWLWVLGLLLAVNLAVLIGLLMRPDQAPAAATDTARSAQPATETTDAFAEQVATAKQNAPPREQPSPAAAETPGTETPAATAVAPSVPANTFALPTIHEVLANGMVSLPELHVDIHVYSEIPEDRFVFINMNKHKEGSRLAEGPLVREITPEGVILNQNGTSFLLPRD